MINLEHKKTLLNLLENNKKGITYYRNIGLSLSHPQLSEWLLHFSEQKEILVRQLRLAMERLDASKMMSSATFSFNKAKPIPPKLLGVNNILKAIKKEETAIVQQYEAALKFAILPNSILLMLQRQKDQIILAMQYLNKIEILAKV